MAIVSSTYVLEAHTQADSRVWVTETHTDSVGNTYRYEYLAEPGTNYQAVADNRAVDLAALLAQAEFEALLNG